MELDAMYSELGASIRAARESAGLSQSELAGKIGFKTPTGISLIESGSRRVSLEDLTQIATALSVSTGDLLGMQEAKTDVLSAIRGDGSLSPKDKEKLAEYYEMLQGRG